jgi:hypothetical protein
MKIYVANKYKVSATFRDSGLPEEICVFTRRTPGDAYYLDNSTAELLEEAKGQEEMPFADFDDLLKVVDHLTPTKPVEKVALGEVKRELVTLGHRLALVEELLTQKNDFSQALKAQRAKRSVIEAIVEVGHMLDSGIDNLVWKE